MTKATATHSIPSGTPCWVELTTTDDVAAQNFYRELFGWEFETRPDPATRSGRYTIASVDGVPVAGICRDNPSQLPYWALHLSVRDSTKVAEWTIRLGGKVTLRPTAIPHRGRIVHVTDPTGAPVVFWELPANWNFGTGKAGMFSGADLNTDNGAVADRFFSKIFSYHVLQLGDGHNIDYTEWQLAHQPVLYRYVMGNEYPQNTPPHWMIYFKIDPMIGVDEAAEHAIDLGGELTISPFDTPFGRIAVITDPAGSSFSIIDHSQTVEGWGQSLIDDPDGD